MDEIFQSLLQKGLTFSPEFVSLACLLFALISLESFHLWGGLVGLNIYNALVVCLANLQVLHITQYCLFTAPLPLGTVLFTTLFLSNTLLVETYGAEAGRQSVGLGMAAYIFFALSMLLSLAHRPAVGEEMFLQQAQLNYDALVRVFVPSGRIFVASLVSFGVSQLVNIAVFERLQKISSRRVLPWSRLGTLLLSGLVDNTVFSYVAFVFLAPTPVPIPVLWRGYILGSLGVRIVVTGLVLGGHTLLRKLFTRPSPNKKFF